MISKKDIIKDLEKNIYCRIQPSKIQGVGVFAIIDIPKGKNPFVTYTDVETIGIPKDEIMKNKKIPKPIKEMVNAFYVIQDGKIYCDARSLNEINITYFLNHSDNPNLNVKEIGGESVFTAKRKIKKGEELTSDYLKYSDNL